VSWSTYASFLVFATVLVLVPGPDFAVVTKTLAGGRRRGLRSCVGVTTSNVIQGVAAAAGLGAVIVRAQPLFHAIKWAGVAYLALLALQAFRSAAAGRYRLAAGNSAGLGLAFTHAVLSLLCLIVVVSSLHQARSVLSCRRVRRALDAASGTALFGIGVKLATD
jgi:threonine/homoserine/homoserine lactone efflux protein